MAPLHTQTFSLRHAADPTELFRMSQAVRRPTAVFGQDLLAHCVPQTKGRTKKKKKKMVLYAPASSLYLCTVAYNELAPA